MGILLSSNSAITAVLNPFGSILHKTEAKKAGLTRLETSSIVERREQKLTDRERRGIIDRDDEQNKDVDELVDNKKRGSNFRDLSRKHHPSLRVMILSTNSETSEFCASLISMRRRSLLRRGLLDRGAGRFDRKASRSQLRRLRTGVEPRAMPQDPIIQVPYP